MSIASITICGLVTSPKIFINMLVTILFKKKIRGKYPLKNIKISTIISIYEKNPVTKALVCGGLEPFDSWEDLQLLVEKFREYFLDDIVIYTGYIEDEVEDKIKWLSSYKNIIIKFGRYVPNDPPHLDKLLGVDLASLNQYAKSYNVMEDYY